jgi:arylsulfatase A-like enzyme
MSLIPLLDGDVSGWRRSFLIEYFSDTVFERIDRMGYKAVRTERHKYIQYQDLDGMHELYDLEADPYELENLIEDPDVSELLEELQLELARHIADVPID